MSDGFSLADEATPWRPSAAGEGIVWEEPKFPHFSLYDTIPGFPLTPVEDVSAPPYCAICSIGTRERHLGSGTLVSPDLVLTAAHVISNGVAATSGTTEMRTLKVLVAGTGEEIPVATAWYYDAGQTHAGQPNDFALLRLGRRSGVAPLSLARSANAPPASITVEVSGYPRWGEQCHSRGKIVNVDHEWLDYALSTLEFQSGSPILFRRVVVGVHLLTPGWGDTSTVANRGLWLRPEIVSWIDRGA